MSAAASFLVLAGAVAVGGAIQGAIGFGFALVAVPVLALLRPGSVPVTVLCIAFPMTVGMALRERRHIDGRGFAWILGGRVLGTAAGVWVLVAVPPDRLEVALGALVVAAAAMSVVGLGLEPTRATTFGAGVLSGVMGTTTAIGGPALAVVYHRRPGPELRSTLAVSFVVGLAMSLAALLIAGRVTAGNLLLAVELLPALAVGLWLSGRLARRLGERWLRPAVLAFAALGGTLILARGLLGA